MKFGIIVTDDDELWGGEKGVGDYIIRRFKERNDANDEFVAIHAVSGNLPTDDEIRSYGGFMITGSHYSVNDNFDWIDRLEHFIRKVYYRSREFGAPRMIGVCFGHQLIAKAFGSRIDNNPGDKFYFGSCTVDIAEEFEHLIYVTKRFGADIKSSMQMMKFHGECVLDKPSIASTLGSSQQCEHEILKYGNSILTTQGHPEYTKKAMSDTNAFIMERIGKLDRSEIKEQLLNIEDRDVDHLTEMVRSFLQRGGKKRRNSLRHI